MPFPKIGKSIWKGIKYTGLAFGGAAVGSIADGGVVSGIVMTALMGAGVPAPFATLVAPIVVPALTGAFTTAAAQIVKHRDEVFVKAPEE